MSPHGRMQEVLLQQVINLVVVALLNDGKDYLYRIPAPEDGLIGPRTADEWTKVAVLLGLPVAINSTLTAAMLRTAPERYRTDLLNAYERLVQERRERALVAIDAALERERDPIRRAFLENRQAYVANPREHRREEGILGNRSLANEASWLRTVDAGSWVPDAAFSNCLGCPQAKQWWHCCRCERANERYESACRGCGHDDCGATAGFSWEDAYGEGRYAGFTSVLNETRRKTDDQA